MARERLSVVDGRRNPKATILLLAWPIFVEQLLASMVQAVDTAMVGSLGKVATAAVAINYAPGLLLQGIDFALGVGFTAVIAQSVGAGRMERAKGLVRQAIMLVTAVCLPLSILYFLLARRIPIWMGGEPEILDQAEIYNQILALSMLMRDMTLVLTAIYQGYGDSKTPMIINVGINGCNVVGNFFMIYPTRTVELLGSSVTIFGFGWGVAGAALSTSLSAIVGGLILLGLCFTRWSPMHISFRESFAPDRHELSTVIQISLPAMLERFALSGAFIVLGQTVASLGTVAVAAQNLSGTAESLSWMPGFAFGTAITTLFGQSIGAGREDLGRRYVSLTIHMGMVVMSVMTLVLFFGAVPIMGIFTPDAEVIEMGSSLLRILAVIQIPQMIAMAYSGALKGAGDSKSPFVITLISMWGVRILGTLICVRVFHLGINAVCVCMCVDNVVRCLLYHLRYRSGAWRRETVR